MTRTKIMCPICNREISRSNYSRHQTGHANNSRYSNKVSIDYTSLNCHFCGKECKNKNSFVNHERKCRLNPNRKNAIIEGFNSKGSTTWNKGLTKETDIRVLKHAEALSRWYAEHPNHILGGLHPNSCRRCKYGTYRNFYCDSAWELAFLVYQLDHNINILRNDTPFKYLYENKVHNYYPDFIIDNVYYEIKGRYTDKDIAKLNQFDSSKTLVVIDSKSIYKYLKYCEKTYGKNFASTLYDRNFPCWLDLADAKKNYQFKIEK